MSAQTQTVAEFVLARIAEAEANARLAHANAIRAAVYQSLRCGSADVVFVHRHDPARVLADCAAKRRIVELHAEQTAERRVAQARTDIDDLVLGHIEGQEMGLAWAVTALASAWSDHPDYRDEWRAEA